MRNNSKQQDQCTVSERNGQLVIALNSEIMLPEDAPVRVTSAQLEELDYRKLYEAYSSKGRKSVTLSRFRTGRCAEAVEDLFYQYVQFLEKQGEVDHKSVFVDGTKIESRAGRYTFNWRGTAEKNLAKAKRAVLEQTGCRILAELESLLSEKAERIEFVRGKGKHKTAEQREWETANRPCQRSYLADRCAMITFLTSLEYRICFFLSNTKPTK